MCSGEIKSLRPSDDEFLRQINDHTLHCRGSEGKNANKTRGIKPELLHSVNFPMCKDFEETNLSFKVGGRVPMPPVCSSQSRERKHDL